MISAPCARGAGTRHAITALPSRKTVHAPHSPSAQPSLVPIKFPSSRNRRSKVLSCPLVKVYFFPLIVVWIADEGNWFNVGIFPFPSFFPHNRIGSDGIPAC